MAELQFERLPAILPCYLRALVSGRSARHLVQVEIPDNRASITALRVDPVRLGRFRTLLGYPDDGLLPPTYPQVLAAPLQLSLLTAKEFPLRATGLVHLGNTIRCDAGIEADKPIDLIVTVGKQATTKQGIEFSLETNVVVAGECCWSATSLLLARTTSKRQRQRQNRGIRPGSSDAISVDVWRADSNIGRRYATVSGDYNPIHLHGLTAKVFGFSAPIAHGMWSLARSLTGLHDQLKTPYKVDVEFLRPMLLPTTVRLLRDNKNPITFTVVDDETEKTYLSGSIS